MKEQTAVEWLIDFIETNIISLEMEIDTPEKHDHWDNAKAKAKQMEKEQMIDAYDYSGFDDNGNFLNGEEYYNEIYQK